MNHSTINILDLCDEILLTIFKKLDNIDVLYSLTGLNQKLDRLVRDITFTRSVDLVAITLNKNNDSKTNSIFDRFCFDIIPGIQHNIECLTLDPLSMDRVLRIGNYPKLYNLILVNLEVEMASHIFNSESTFIHIFKHQITHLTITINDDNNLQEIKNVAINIFANIFVIFQNLIRLKFQLEDIFVYPPTSFVDLPIASCYSSKIIYLSVRVACLDDCFYLLNGRFSQLQTFIVKVDFINDSSIIVDNKKVLSNLKCLSLVSFRRTTAYDRKVVPLLRQMSQIEKLTLSLVVKDRTSFIDGIQLHNDVLSNMPNLHTFHFDIVTENVTIDKKRSPSSDDIRHTFIKRGQHVDCYIDYYINGTGRCHVYSIPFTMTRMNMISNNFRGGIFMNVRRLSVCDYFRSFEHEYFARISQAFPLLENLVVLNTTKQKKKRSIELDDHEQTSWIVEYSHLTILRLTMCHIDYAEEFLFDSNTRLPRLNTLYIEYNDLVKATEDFTSNSASGNCAKLKNIIFEPLPIIYSKHFYDYFPLV